MLAMHPDYLASSQIQGNRVLGGTFRAACPATDRLLCGEHSNVSFRHASPSYYERAFSYVSMSMHCGRWACIGRDVGVNESEHMRKGCQHTYVQVDALQTTVRAYHRLPFGWQWSEDSSPVLHQLPPKFRHRTCPVAPLFRKESKRHAQLQEAKHAWTIGQPVFGRQLPYLPDIRRQFAHMDISVDNCGLIVTLTHRRAL